MADAAEERRLVAISVEGVTQGLAGEGHALVVSGHVRIPAV